MALIGRTFKVDGRHIGTGVPLTDLVWISKFRCHPICRKWRHQRSRRRPDGLILIISAKLGLAISRLRTLPAKRCPSRLFIMAGTTTGCGDHLHFTPGGIGIMRSMSGIDEPVDWHPGPDDPWRPRVENLLNELLDKAEGNFLVAA